MDPSLADVQLVELKELPHYVLRYLDLPVDADVHMKSSLDGDTSRFCGFVTRSGVEMRKTGLVDIYSINAISM